MTLFCVFFEKNPFGERREERRGGELHFECCQMSKKKLKIGPAFNLN
jgi:hypothetical protein